MKSNKKVWCMLLLLAITVSSFVSQPVKNIEAKVYTKPEKSFEEFMKPAKEDRPNVDRVDITLTRYYPNDETGADTCMATMCVNKLQVNDKGWYTYKGMVVIAAATYACQQKCKHRDKYGPLPDDFRIYNFYDEIKFAVDGVEYTGVVLDSCGACMYHINGEKLQRYDIFTVSGKSTSSLISGKNVGKTKAELIVESPSN